MAVEVISYGLLEFMIRRPLLEPLVEEMSQVLVEPSSAGNSRFVGEHIVPDLAGYKRTQEDSICHAP